MKPKFLQAKDKVAIIAPSGRVFEKDLTANLKWLQSLDLDVVLGKNLFENHYQAYHYAGSVAQRLADLQWALDDEEIQAIWCARGGYGAVHLLDHINWEKFKQHPKWLIGYSDVTALHSHINQLNIGSLHAMTVKQLNLEYSPESLLSLKTALMGEVLQYEIAPHPLNRLGHAKGRLIGGNLSLLYSLLGSSSFEIRPGDILFIEDWNENWYHIDRMLTSLKRSGALNALQALLIGSFTQMDTMEDNPNFRMDFDPMTDQLIDQLMKEFHFPMAFQFPAGHIGDNRALILGTEIELNITKNQVTLEFI